MIVTRDYFTRFVNKDRLRPAPPTHGGSKPVNLRLRVTSGIAGAAIQLIKWLTFDAISWPTTLAHNCPATRAG